MLIELDKAGAAKDRNQREDRAHGELRLVHRRRIGDRTEHVDRRLVHVRGDACDPLGREVVRDDDRQQRVGRGMRVPARRVELERRFRQRPSLAETVGELRRIGIGRHAGGHSLRALEDVLRAGEPALRETSGEQPVRRRLRRVQLFRVGGVAQEFPQAADCVPAEPNAFRIASADRPSRRPVAAAAASVPAVPVVWNTL